MAQLVEQLIRNQQAVGSSPISSSKKSPLHRLFSVAAGAFFLPCPDFDYFLTTFRPIAALPFSPAAPVRLLQAVFPGSPPHLTTTRRGDTMARQKSQTEPVFFQRFSAFL